jgi:hypothetical protein
VYDAGQRLGRRIEREGFAEFRAAEVDRVEADADKAARHHDLTADDPNGLYTVLEDEQEDELALKGGGQPRKWPTISLRL